MDLDTIRQELERLQILAPGRWPPTRPKTQLSDLREDLLKDRLLTEWQWDAVEQWVREGQPAGGLDRQLRWDGYTLVRHIRSGGMGDVYEAVDPTTRRRVALKLIRLPLEDDLQRDGLLRFAREAEALRVLSGDPRIPEFLGQGTFDDCPYLAMEFVAGDNLQVLVERLRREGNAPSVETVVHWLIDIARTLEYIHQKIIHRDIKPLNLIWTPGETPDGRIRVVDFGLARPQGPGSGRTFTHLGVRLGSPGYTAPELQEGRPATTAVDIFSLGATALFLLTGTCDTGQKEPTDDLPRSLRTRLPDLPPELLELIALMLAENPGKRPKANSVAGFLTQWLVGISPTEPELADSWTVPAEIRTLPGDALLYFSPPGTSGALARLGTFTVTRILGWGGVGIACQVRDGPNEFAVKMLRPDRAGQSIHVTSLAEEYHILQQLQDDSIGPRVYESGEIAPPRPDLPPLPYFRMELLQGQTLRDYLRTAPGLSVESVIGRAVQLAQALCVIHGASLFHRDFTPCNIWIDLEGRIRVLDFGFAHAGGPLRSPFAGTPEYAAPEQLYGEPMLDARCDLFALGCVLYEIASRRRAFDDAGRWRPPTPPEVLNPQISLAFSAVILRLLQFDPAARYQTATEVLQTLRALQPVDPPPIPEPPAPVRPEGSSQLSLTAPAPLTAILAGGLVAVLLAVSSFLSWPKPEAPQPKPVPVQEWYATGIKEPPPQSGLPLEGFNLLQEFILDPWGRDVAFGEFKTEIHKAREKTGLVQERADIVLISNRCQLTEIPKEIEGPSGKKMLRAALYQIELTTEGVPRRIGPWRDKSHPEKLFIPLPTDAQMEISRPRWFVLFLFALNEIEWRAMQKLESTKEYKVR